MKKGGAFVEASWDEAFEAVDRGLQRVIETHGRPSLAAYLGNPNAHNFESSLYTRPLLKSLGTRNIFSASTVDQMPRHVSSGLLYGSPTTIPV
ncbi:molybdopterin-dependent oxidoreductase, partial [Myxococcota bacterium]|nr:molybdopterin-dependent oxidoreductase [Myxococcota bacterium]